jgi:hypothetical protein
MERRNIDDLLVAQILLERYYDKRYAALVEQRCTTGQPVESLPLSSSNAIENAKILVEWKKMKCKK